MTLELKKMTTGKAKAPRIEEGAYMSRIVSIVDLGVQPQTDWQTGEPSKSQPRVLITWELPTETIEVTNDDGETEDRPRWISKEYTISNYEMSNLYKLLVALGKKEVKCLSELLDITCMVTVGTTQPGNAKIVQVGPTPKDMPVPELANEAKFFDFDKPNSELYDLQPDWIKEKIKDAENYGGFADEWCAPFDA